MEAHCSIALTFVRTFNCKIMIFEFWRQKCLNFLEFSEFKKQESNFWTQNWVCISVQSRFTWQALKKSFNQAIFHHIVKTLFFLAAFKKEKVSLSFKELWRPIKIRKEPKVWKVKKHLRVEVAAEKSKW